MNNNKLDILYSKYKELKKYKRINILSAIILSLIGVVSITEIIIILNRYAQVNILLSVLSLFSLTSIYSCIGNIMLEKQDKSIEDINIEIKELENNLIREINKDNYINKSINISNLELRFDGLSTENKIKLLKFIKSKTKDQSMYNKLNVLEKEDSVSLIDDSYKYRRTKKTNKR